MNPSVLITQGYRVISRRFGIIARIDRPDWLEKMAIEYAPWDIREGIKWVKALGDNAQDHYRRCNSKDRLEIPLNIARLIPNSIFDPVAYIPKEEHDAQLETSYIGGST